MPPRNLKENDKLNIRQHTTYNQINTRASGGTSIIVNNTLPQSRINLHKPTGNSSISNFTQNNLLMLIIHTHQKQHD